MEVGTEISQKIRSAIKAKLMEIGSYVDDELPDYIMVMVANKKTKQQMADDLSLFLGANTDVFTTWLHGLLVKLQTVSADSNKSEKAKVSKDKKHQKKNKKSKEGAESKTEKRKVSKTVDNDFPKAKSAKVDTVQERDNGQAETQNKELGITTATKESADNDDNHAKEQSNCIKESDSKLDDVEDVRQLLVTEAPEDELAAELETTEAVITNQKSTISNTTALRKDTLHSHVITKNLISNQETTAETASTSRKRKCPSSVVATIRRRDDQDKEDDSAPIVASVVKVTARKSSFPQSMQANSEDVSFEEEEKFGEPRDSTSLDGQVSLNVVKQALSQVLKQFQDKEDDIGVFCKSLERSLRKMSLGDLAITKIKIQKVLFDYEMSQHKQAKNSQIQMASSESSALSSTDASRHQSLSKEMMIPHNPSKSQGLGPSDNSSAAPRLTSFPGTSPDDNSKRTEVEKSEGNSRQLGIACSREEANEKSKRSDENLPERIIFGPKQKEREAIRPPDSRQPHVVKDLPSSDSSVVSNLNRLQSVPTAVSSTVVESSGFDSPSSSHPSSSVQINWPSPSTNTKAANTLQKSGNNNPQPTILVSSLHQKRRFDSDSPSVLRHSMSQDAAISKNAQPQAGDGIPDSSKEISPEQLKVLAKNLKITVVNKRALKLEDKSNSEESSSGESEEESDSAEEDSDEEDDNDTNKVKEPTAI